jgi:hypothetical protein
MSATVTLSQLLEEPYGLEVPVTVEGAVDTGYVAGEFPVTHTNVSFADDSVMSKSSSRSGLLAPMVQVPVDTVERARSLLLT